MARFSVGFRGIRWWGAYLSMRLMTSYGKSCSVIRSDMLR